ncbi:hypothetical protein GF351_05075 [Candidatus Woesearchaeota archaeon]|nr:hypothetical protein [Candidatus Woesearchaeota archaeon]
MSFMKSNVNVVLLGLVILSMAGIVVITVYYQETFDQLYDEYETKLRELNQTMIELDVHMKQLNTTQFELEIRSEREEELSGKYTDVKEKKDDIAEELNDTAAELKQTKDDYIRTHNQLRITEKDLEDTKDALEDAMRKLNNYENAVASLDDNAEDVRTTINIWLGDPEDVCYELADDIDEDFDDLEEDISALKDIS